MNLTVFTNRDNAEEGPSLDREATMGWFEAQADGRIRFVFTASTPNMGWPDDDAERLREIVEGDLRDPRLSEVDWVRVVEEIGEDQGLWTVVLDMVSGEALALADELRHRATEAAAAKVVD